MQVRVGGQLHSAAQFGTAGGITPGVTALSVAVGASSDFGDSDFWGAASGTQRVVVPSFTTDSCIAFAVSHGVTEIRVLGIPASLIAAFRRDTISGGGGGRGSRATSARSSVWVKPECA